MFSRLRREKKGFTLIELIMVIVILGIVAAVAVPKFLSLRATATDGVALGVHAALMSTIQTQHAKYLVDPDNTANAYTITTVKDGVDVKGITLAVSGTNITATIKGKTYTWAYTTYSGDDPATIDLTTVPTGSAIDVTKY